MEESKNESGPKRDDLPPGWELIRVGQAGMVRLGRQRSPSQHSGTYPTKYVRAANITPGGLDLTDVLEMDFTPAEREVFGLRSGDVLLTEASGSASQVGRAAIWRGEIEPCCYQNTVIRFRPYLTTPEYALLVFRHLSAAGVFARTARGVGIQHLGGSRFAELDFPLPPMAEQRRIADIADGRLAEIREAEARLRSALANLKEQVREILAAAVAGELARQNGGARRQRVPSLLQPGRKASLFTDERAPMAELVNFNWSLPVGWHWARIDDIGTVTLGRQRSPQHEIGSHMRPYLRVANVLEDRIDFSDLKEMNFTPQEATIYTLHKGDILLNEGQSPELVGRPALYNGTISGLCFQNTLIRFRAGDEVVPDFALIVFRHYMHAGVFQQIAKWSTNIAHLGLERFRSLPFPVPSMPEQERIVAAARSRLDAATAQTDAVSASLTRLPEMERELLAAAVVGKLIPQDPADEPAQSLIQRVGYPREPKEEPPHQDRKGGPMPKNRSRTTRQAEPTRDLSAVLLAAGGALPLPELFARAGYNRDSPEHVELFYLALREELGRTIRMISDTAENAQLEIANATP